MKIYNRYTNEVIWEDEELDTLKGANLEGANLKDADLEGANLEGANLENADLEGAYLEGADLRNAYLEDADLKGAYLENADLRNAYLKDANLQGADLPDNFFQFVGFGRLKRCTTFDLINKKVICGCFYGSIEEFEVQVIETHKNNEHAKQYLSIIEIMKGLIEKGVLA